MIRKMLGSLVILAVVVVAILCLVIGRDTVSGIAENVLDAAKEELAEQIEGKLAEMKVEVLEVKPVVGSLNDDGGEYQFFCACLIQTDSETSAKDCAKALSKVFGEADYMQQTQREVEADPLENKNVRYKLEDYSDGNYYTVYVYVPAIDEVIDIDSLTKELEK